MNAVAPTSNFTGDNMTAQDLTAVLIATNFTRLARTGVAWLLE
jgi:hypothetical protein